MTTSAANQRKRPHCTKCGGLMAGHTRDGGSFVCPDARQFLSPKPEPREVSLRDSPAESLPSPPASPPPQSTFQIPPGNKWHWRNPNWFSPPSKKRQSTPSESRQSLAPTEPASEFGDYGRERAFFTLPRYATAGGMCAGERRSLTPTEPATEDDEGSDYEKENSPFYERENSPFYDEPDPLYYHPGERFLQPREDSPEYYGSPGSPPPRPWSPLSQSPVVDISLQTALRGSSPLFSTFRVPREDLQKVHQTAEREGKYVGVMEAPPGQSENIPQEKADGTVWVVVGYDEAHVRHIVQMQQMSLPGAMERPAGNSRELGFFQLALAGIVGGFMVTCGLAFL
ncbi:hypothetical protein BV22DRAFT_1190614 [Leucogyrophana mollusca]|uniref:Uncharacterized protein n=1 Tax=Leucogyrophana mollusca TaxID=85980 RepID=A0ACB8C080_9AGAM|nr:hypothetical protein BV22DRAFT_1190614 [Leucogyrophana mollusca]